MYAKYLIRRVKYGRTKLWQDWKEWRNWPTMQYRDVYNIHPGSYTWRYLSPSSIPISADSHSQYITEDYKTPYKKSERFLRKFPPDSQPIEVNYSKFNEKEQTQINEIFDNYPGLKKVYDKTNIKFLSDIEEGDKEENIKTLVRSSFEAVALKATHQGLNFNAINNMPSIKSNYDFTSETLGMDKSLDANEGNPSWEQIYFDNLQRLYNYDEFLKEEYDYKMPVYVGRTKKWQVVNDYLGKEQVDKVQVSIGAPIQDQLDQWDEENTEKFIQMPINNENHAKFRDKPLHYERLDHDYDQILYERKRNQIWEKIRNSRWWELDKNNNDYE